MEDIIKQRAIAEDWDDLAPRELPDVDWHKNRGTLPEVSQEKSKLGLRDTNLQYLKRNTEERGDLTMDKVHLTLPRGDRVTTHCESMRLGLPCCCPSGSCDCDGCEEHNPLIKPIAKSMDQDSIILAALILGKILVPVARAANMEKIDMDRRSGVLFHQHRETILFWKPNDAREKQLLIRN